MESTIVCRLWHVDAQTKCTHHPPKCGDDVDALGWSVLASQAMVGAKAARCYGCGKKQKRYSRRGLLYLVCLYVG